MSMQRPCQITGVVFFPLAGLVLTMVPGPLMERGLRQSLEMSQGDVSILFTRPLSATLLVIALLVIATSTFRALVKFL